MPIPSLTDVVTPFDLTNPNYQSITSAQLMQLVSGISPYADKGLIVTTTDALSEVDSSQTLTPNVPDAATNIKWKQYLWLRISPQTTNNGISTSPIVGVYAWNPNGATGPLLNWVPIGVGTIGAGSILGSQIAAGTITDINIADISWGKIINAPAFIPPAGSITTSMLIDGCVTPSKLSAGTIAFAVPRITAAGNAFEYTTPNVITQLTNPSAGMAGQPVVVNSTNDGYIVGPAPSAGTQFNQIKYVKSSALANLNGSSSSANIYPLNAVPIISKGLLVLQLPTINPLMSSTFIINAIVNVGASVAGNVVIALFDSAAGSNAVAAASVYVPTNTACIPVSIQYMVANAANTARTFYIYFAPSGGFIGYVNSSASSGGNNLGGSYVSSAVIYEF